jgi:hypothetical protein
MADGRSRRSWPGAPRFRWWLGGATLAATIGLGLAAGTPRSGERTAEVWTALVQTGDELAAGQLTATLAGQPLTARKAYLLAFHQAQDVADLEHVLFVADRLDAAREPELAAHVRRAADALQLELGP